MNKKYDETEILCLMISGLDSKTNFHYHILLLMKVTH